jgi:hypothetical protein
MRYHQIIRDINLLKNFIYWLPELEDNEAFFLCLQARKKYMPSLKTSDKTQLKRFVASSKDHLLEKIRQLECPVGSYRTDDDEPIEDEGMVLYITPNPRDMKKASFNTIKALADTLQNEGKNLNPHSEALSQIHKTKSRSIFVHFDIDFPTGTISDANARKCDLSIKEIYEKVISIVGLKAVELLNTRGGCHVLIRPDLVVSKNKNWFPEISKVINSDQCGDLMIPVVGCCQGGFIPHFYKPEKQ